MKKYKLLFAIGVLTCLSGVFAENAKKDDDVVADFENEETFVDVPDALRSKHYVHRAILSTLIRDTNSFHLGSFYINHLLGFNAVYQPSNGGGKSFAKFVSGALGVAFGYATKGGHAFEAGVEASALTNMLVGYRYVMTSDKYSFWPYLGGGMGMELSAFRLSDLPVEAQAYQGKTSLFYVALGAMIPVVDIGLRAEARFNFYGFDRLMLTTGLGVIFFL